MPRIEVVDIGIGVAVADQSAIFESFAQAEAATTRRYGGTGLGLAISRQLVDLMGGQIGVRSSLGQDGTLSIEVPLQPAEAVAAQP
ncbi:MAG: ATP-binding protein [Acidimicrobiales bacterium]